MKKNATLFFGIMGVIFTLSLTAYPAAANYYGWPTSWDFVSLTSDSLDVSGAVTADSVSATGDVSGATLTASGVNVLTGADSTLLSSASDLDTLSDGWYSWANSVPLNAPGGIAYMSLVQINDGSQPSQLAFGGASPVGEVWGRRKNSGTWSAWTRAWTSANDGIGSGLDADTIDGTAITGSEIWTASNDGSGSGLDADTIDGTAITGSEIWTAGNDGAGSGLDADTTDGIHVIKSIDTLDFPSLAAGASTYIDISISGVDTDDICVADIMSYSSVLYTLDSTSVGVRMTGRNVGTATVDPPSMSKSFICYTD